MNESDDEQFEQLKSWLSKRSEDRKVINRIDDEFLRANRKSKRLLLILLAISLVGILCVARYAQAATVPIKITVTLPTIGCTIGVTSCDNIPLTGAAALVGSEIFVSTSPIPDVPANTPTHLLGAGVTLVSSTIAIANGGTIYARGRVRTATQVSRLGPQMAYMVDLPVIPGAPLLTIESVAYQINLGSNNKITLSRVAAVPLGKECSESVTITDEFRTVHVLKDRNWAAMDPDPKKPGQLLTRPRQVLAKCERRA